MGEKKIRDIYNFFRGFEKDEPAWFDEFVQTYKTYNVSSFGDLKVFLKLEFLNFDYIYQVGFFFVFMLLCNYCWIADEDEIWMEDENAELSPRFVRLMKTIYIVFDMKDPDDFFLLVSFNLTFAIYYSMDPTMGDGDVFDEMLEFSKSFDNVLRLEGDVGDKHIVEYHNLNDEFLYWKEIWAYLCQYLRETQEIYDTLALNHGSVTGALYPFEGIGYKYKPNLKELCNVGRKITYAYTSLPASDAYVFTYKVIDEDEDDDEWTQWVSFIWVDHTLPFLYRDTYTHHSNMFDSYMYYNYFFVREEIHQFPLVYWIMGDPGHREYDKRGMLLYWLREPEYLGKSSEFLKWLDSCSLDPENEESNFNLILRGPVGNKLKRFKTK